MTFKIYRIALRELCHNKFFSLLFIFNFTLGLTGFLSLQAFKSSINQTLSHHSKSLMGADLSIGGRRPLTAKEKEVVGPLLKNFEKTEVIELFSMVSNLSKKSRLYQIKAIETNFPFYGKIHLDSSPLATEEKKVWVYPEILKQLSLKVGDQIQIGDESFTISAQVQLDSGQSLTSQMAPRIFMEKRHLESTGLIKKGSLAFYSTLYKMPFELTDKALSDLRLKIFKALDTQDVRVSTHKNAGMRMGTILNRTSDFLGLSTLAAFFLAGIGASFLFRAYLFSRTRQIALLVSLGLSRFKASFYYLFQVWVLTGISYIASLLLSSLLLTILAPFLESLLPIHVHFTFNHLTIFSTLGVALLGSSFMVLPLLAQIYRIPASLLLTHVETDSSGRASKAWFKTLILFTPATLFFWGMAIFLSHSFKMGSLFCLLFLGSALFFVLISYPLWWITKSMIPQQWLATRWALRDMGRFPLMSLSLFVCIGLSLTLMNIIPQLQNSLWAELNQPDKNNIPSFFLFDIQDEQVEGFKKAVRAQGGTLQQVSPMVRARLIEVNGAPFEKGEGVGSNQLMTREAENEMRFRNRGFNLSYRDHFSSFENIIAGEKEWVPYEEEKQDYPFISMEKRFAKRLNLKLGDVLTFDIESVPVTGKIVNLRTVRWSSFRPNFFILFQPGVLEMAPKVHVATIGHLPMDKKYALQDNLVGEFPNISIVDVSRVIEKLNFLVDQIILGLKLMSALCFLASQLVLFSIANHAAHKRRFEGGLIKALGGQKTFIHKLFTAHFCLISFSASLVGTSTSLLMSFLLSYFLFDQLWTMDLLTPLFMTVISFILSLLVIRVVTQFNLKFPAQELLMESKL